MSRKSELTLPSSQYLCRSDRGSHLHPTPHPHPGAWRLEPRLLLNHTSTRPQHLA